MDELNKSIDSRKKKEETKDLLVNKDHTDREKSSEFNRPQCMSIYFIFQERPGNAVDEMRKSMAWNLLRPNCLTRNEVAKDRAGS